MTKTTRTNCVHGGFGKIKSYRDGRFNVARDEGDTTYLPAQLAEKIVMHGDGSEVARLAEMRLPASVRELVRLVISYESVKTRPVAVGQLAWQIVTADANNHVFRTLGINLVRFPRPYHAEETLGTVATGLVFGAGDPTWQLSRGREESLAVTEAAEWLKSTGLPVTHRDYGYWDDGKDYADTDVTPVG